MDEKQEHNELSGWFSTYGTITSERILSKYQIVLKQEELIAAVKNPFNFYHKLLKVPLKNVLNGIILQQANDYHVYTQKLFIDYLLSGESAKPDDAQGAYTRELLEEERKKLVALGEEFHKKQTQHDMLVGSSQSSLIKITNAWRASLESAIKGLNTTFKNHRIETKKSIIRKGINYALIHCDVIQQKQSIMIDKANDIIQVPLTSTLKEHLLDNLTDFFENILVASTKFEDLLNKANDINEEAKSYRTEFYNSILRVTELFKVLPEYKIDEKQDAINRETLYFDKSIGDNQ